MKIHHIGFALFAIVLSSVAPVSAYESSQYGDEASDVNANHQVDLQPYEAYIDAGGVYIPCPGGWICIKVDRPTGQITIDPISPIPVIR